MAVLRGSAKVRVLIAGISEPNPRRPIAYRMDGKPLLAPKRERESESRDGGMQRKRWTDRERNPSGRGLLVHCHSAASTDDRDGSCPPWDQAPLLAAEGRASSMLIQARGHKEGFREATSPILSPGMTSPPPWSAYLGIAPWTSRYWKHGCGQDREGQRRCADVATVGMRSSDSAFLPAS